MSDRIDLLVEVAVQQAIGLEEVAAAREHQQHACWCDKGARGFYCDACVIVDELDTAQADLDGEMRDTAMELLAALVARARA